MENNKLETKQNYLRNVILNKGYNAQDFFNFLIEKKGEEGGDLNNWDFIELENVVKEFQSIYNSNNINKNIENIENNNNNDIDNLIENNNNDKNNFQNNYHENLTENNNIKKEIKDINDNKKNIYLLEIQCLSDDKGPLTEYNQLNIKLSE